MGRRLGISIAIAAAALAAAGCRAPAGEAGDAAFTWSEGIELAPGEAGTALVGGRVLALDGRDQVHDPGLVLVRGGQLAYVGPPRQLPAGYESIDCGGRWIVPGMVDLHSHVSQGRGFGDLNDSVLPINVDLRASSTLVPGNSEVDRACASGITTLFGIPGSGSSTSGFGVLYKTRTDSTWDEAVVAAVGGQKVAQTHNPERRAGDLGQTRAGLYWMLGEVNDRALLAADEGRFDPALENLKKVHAKELPVLIHCAGADGVSKAVRMWKDEYDTRCIVSHGCFTGYREAEYVARMGVPVNCGPRTIDFVPTRDSRFVGIAKVYTDAGVPDFSLNTDAPVIPEEELFLQGSMSARFGADPYQMLRALTTHPARSIGLGERLGSLEPGKDADVVVFNGDPLDPRSRVELVLIDGTVQYDRERDGQLF